MGVALMGAACAVAVSAAWIPLRKSYPSVDVALALVAATTAVAVAGRRAAVIGAAAGSAFGFTFFDTEPYEHLGFTYGSDVATAVLLVVVGLATGELALRVVHQRRSDRGAGGGLGLIREAAGRLAHGEELVLMIGATADQITMVLGAAGCSFSTEEEDAGLPFIDRDGRLQMAEPASAARRSATAPARPAGTASSPSAAATTGQRTALAPPPPALIALPVLSQGAVVGRFVVRPHHGAPMSRERCLVAVTLADQVGAALAAQAPPIPPMTDGDVPVVPSSGPLLRVVR
jgi:K+-sensing histidine kinase KdpD